MNTIQKYKAEVAVFVIGMLFVFVALTLLWIRDHSGMDRYCDNFPSHCAPAEYPGKVVEK